MLKGNRIGETTPTLHNKIFFYVIMKENGFQAHTVREQERVHFDLKNWVGKLFLLEPRAASFLMREASSRWVCPSVCVSVCHTFLQIFNTREKVHIVSARDISTFLCVEMALSLKILEIFSEREILTFLHIDSE